MIGPLSSDEGGKLIRPDTAAGDNSAARRKIIGAAPARKKHWSQMGPADGPPITTD